MASMTRRIFDEFCFLFFFNFFIIKNFIQDLIKLTQIHLGYYYLNIFFIFEKNESPCNAAGKKL
jgi:hypothetical protein